MRNALDESQMVNSVRCHLAEARRLNRNLVCRIVGVSFRVQTSKHGMPLYDPFSDLCPFDYT